jgi:glycerophosphoryl diester phosphodiesterase
MALSSPAHMICFAHRGASGYEPENTLRSFSKALELGATWIECDVRKVEDELVVFHDRTLSRLTGSAGWVGNQTIASIRALKVKGTEQIPLLSEVLALIHGKARAQLELKGAGSGDLLARYLNALLSQGWASDSFIVSSFDHEELASFKRACPSVPIGVLLYGYPMNTPHIAQALGAYSVHLDLETVTPKRVGTLHELGFKVFVYTVNEQADIAAMRAIGVDGVFSDYPDRVISPSN